MPSIVVTPLCDLEPAIAAHRPSHIITLLSPEHMIGTPAGFPPARHLRLGLNDVADPADGLAPPARDHVDRILAFSRGWNADAPLLIHCWAGISRSMATAFAVLCDRLHGHGEMDIAIALRRRAPYASPNTLLVGHADAALAREGRMVTAIRALGPAHPAERGVATAFPLADL